MCGIIGIVGKNATEAVLSGLSTLEYRGYDSCGLCYKKQSSLVVKKVAGRVSGLKALPMENSTVAIGHTRWATHGKPSAENSHPHLSYDGNFAIVHNGIVENLGEVKSILKSVPLKSQTDSELIAHLLAHFYAGSVREAVERTAETLKGTFTFLAMSVYDDNVYAYRKNAGLIVGLGDGFGVVASDVTALSSLVENAVVLADDDLAVIGEDSVEFFRFGRRVEKTSVPVSLYKTSPLSADTYMQSEIDEIPSALLSTVTSLLSPEGLSSFTESSRFDNVFISGCGTAYHASLYGKTVFEKIAKIKHNSMVISKKPYFFRYLYPELNQRFKQFEASYNQVSRDMFGIKFKKLLKKENKTDEELALVRKYQKFSPLITSDCTMNRLCREFESIDFDIKFNKDLSSSSSPSSSKDSKKAVVSKLPTFEGYFAQDFSQEKFDFVKSLYQAYTSRRQIKHLSAILANSQEFLTTDDYSEIRSTVYNAIIEDIQQKLASASMPGEEFLFYCNRLSKTYSSFN